MTKINVQSFNIKGFFWEEAFVALEEGRKRLICATRAARYKVHFKLKGRIQEW